MGAPHILSQHAAPSAVSRTRRGVMTTEWSATSTCGRGSVLAAQETPGPNAGSPLPAVMRDQCISSSVKRKYEKKWLIARIWSRRP